MKTKIQTSVEVSTYGSEFVALRTGVELFLEVQSMLQEMGFK